MLLHGLWSWPVYITPATVSNQQWFWTALNRPSLRFEAKPGPSRLNLKSSQTFRSGIVQASSATARSRGNSISCHKDVAGIPHIHKLGRVTRERQKLRKWEKLPIWIGKSWLNDYKPSNLLASYLETDPKYWSSHECTVASFFKQNFKKIKFQHVLTMANRTQLPLLRRPPNAPNACARSSDSTVSVHRFAWTPRSRCTASARSPRRFKRSSGS